MRLLQTVSCILSFAVMVSAQTIVFEWDSHPEATQIDGFRLYQGKQSGNYTGVVAFFQGGALTTGTIQRPGLGRWYFALTAITPVPDSLESGFSNEVSVVIKPKEPVLKTATLAILTAPLKGARKLGEWAGIVERKQLRLK